MCGLTPAYGEALIFISVSQADGDPATRRARYLGFGAKSWVGTVVAEQIDLLLVAFIPRWFWRCRHVALPSSSD